MSTTSEAPHSAPREHSASANISAPPETESQVNDSAIGVASEAPPRVQRRRGDVSKCPICGSAVDGEAFHCAQCHNYFCFHCRARLLKSDLQLQCCDQECDYYAKLICSVCNPPIIKEEPPSEFVEPLDGYWPLWLIVSLIVGGVTWYYSSFYPAAATAIGLFGIGGFLLHRAGVSIFGGERRVMEQRTTTYHTCIRCQHLVKEVSGGA